MPSNEFARHNKEISRQIVVFRVEYLWNGMRYSSSVFTVSKGNSRATNGANLVFVVVIVPEI